MILNFALGLPQSSSKPTLLCLLSESGLWRRDWLRFRRSRMKWKRRCASYIGSVPCDRRKQGNSAMFWLGRLIERYIEKRVPPVSREAIEAEMRKRHAEIGSRVARRKVGG
jgi:hypothetical protein